MAIIDAGAFFALAIFHLATTQIPGYLKQLGYASPYMTAGVIALMSLIAIPSSLLFGKIGGALIDPTILLLVFAFGAVGFAVAGAGGSLAMLLVGLAIFSLPYGLRTPAFNDWSLDTAPECYRGRLTGGLTAATFAGIFASPLLSTLLMRWRWTCRA